MRRTSYTIALALSVAPIPSIFAASIPTACTASSWGWPGFVMGNNPWGAVLSPSGSSALSSALSTACASYNVTSSTSSSAKASTTSISVVYAASSASTTPVSSPATTSTTTRTSATPSAPVTSSTTIRSSTSSSTPFTTSTSTRTSSISSSNPVTTSTSTTTSSIPASSSSSSSSAVPASSSSAPFSSSSPNGSGASDSDVSTYLSTHNTVRSQHGASALVWNNTLAAAAQKWSNACVFKHSGGTLGPYGENLAAGTGSAYSITSAVTSWTNEASQYNAGNPVPSHFTQVVWKATTQLGCAVTSCAGGTIFPASYGNTNYYVCEYYPQGNVIGAFGTNVQV